MAAFNYRKAIKNNFWLTVFSILSLILLIVLGTWQVERLEWKNQLIDKVTARTAEPAVRFSKTLPLEENEFRKTTITGRFLNEREIHMGAKYYRGKIGFQIITPFRLKDGSTVLVNRGWVPLEMKEQEKRKDTLVKGETTIDGIILHPQRQGPFTPDNDLNKNYWFWLDMKGAINFTNTALVPFVIVEQGKNEKDKFPVKLEVQPEFRNDHLQYAFTWFSLAIILVVVYISYIRKNPGKK